VSDDSFETRVRALAGSAADLIESHGWCQFINKLGPRGPYCVAGALNELSPGSDWVESKENAEVRLRVRRLTNYLYTYEFNDTPGRTAAEVVEVLRRIAKGEGA
jgi:hypothetical protein